MLALLLVELGNYCTGWCTKQCATWLPFDHCNDRG